MEENYNDEEQLEHTVKSDDKDDEEELPDAIERQVNNKTEEQSEMDKVDIFIQTESTKFNQKWAYIQWDIVIKLMTAVDVSRRYGIVENIIWNCKPKLMLIR